jgi:gliding motility-associated-like protein/uncharacterized repeat protein (TIGR01451 family)
LVDLTDIGTISGTTTSNLTISAVTSGDEILDYNVVVSGDCLPSEISQNTSLSLTTSPIITTQPQDQVSCEGSTVNFTVVAIGTNLTYQWRKGLVDLTDIGTISGTTTTTLTISAVTSGDEILDYNVVVSGDCLPSETSQNASLGLIIKPTSVATSNSPLCLNGNLNLEAQASTGTYNWSGPNGFVSTLQNPILLNVSLIQSGEYKLVVVNGGCVSDTSKITVVIIDCSVDLSIIKSVNNLTPMIGENVHFLITVKNEGMNDATNVYVDEQLKDGYSFISSDCSVGSYNSVTGIWAIGNLPVSSMVEMVIIAKVNKVGNYENTVNVISGEIDNNLLDNTATITPIPTDFFIPEGFSPNGDMINDLFVIRGILNFPNNKIIIFNRWGNKVYGAEPYDNKWDGTTTEGLTLGGSELPVGTYFYLLDLGDGSKVLKGSIYLNR